MATLEVSRDISLPKRDVFRAYRDSPEVLSPYLSRVESIELRQRNTLDENTVQTVTRWKPLNPDVPDMISQYIDSDILGWTIIATWYEDEWFCEWEVQTGFLEEAVRFSGNNSFETTGNQSTLVTINGNVSVEATRIPGVPGLLSSRISQASESFLIRLLRPTFEDILGALENHLNTPSS